MPDLVVEFCIMHRLQMARPVIETPQGLSLITGPVKRWPHAFLLVMLRRRSPEVAALYLFSLARPSRNPRLPLSSSGQSLAWSPRERRSADFSPQGCWSAKDPSSVAVLPRLSAASVAGLLRSTEALARILRRVEALKFGGRVCAVLTFLRNEFRAPKKSELRTPKFSLANRLQQVDSIVHC